jgi:choline dehydrogenase
VLAARLSEDPARTVCLVEAGPDYGPFDGGAWPDDLLDARSLAFSHAWATEREDRSQLRARVIGGCSSHNACVVLRGAPEDYDAWGPGWTHADLTPYLERAERAFAPRQFAPDEFSPWHRAFADATGADAIPHVVNARGATRWNAGFAFLDPARERGNLTIRSDALVDRVILDGGRARGLVTDGGEIRARTVVLAAGAYGSPAILLRSAVDPTLPVGLGLQDHVGVGLGFEGTPTLQREAGRFAAANPLFMAQVSIRGRSSSCEPGLWDTFLFPALERASDGTFEASAAVFAMKTYSRGSVRLTSPDPMAPLAIDHGFLSDPRDTAVVSQGVERLRELVASAGLAELAGREIRPGPGIDAERHVRQAVRGFFHPTGTCALGAVVGADCCVLGTEGLYVADASVMPEVPRANTNLSTAAIAERVAEALAGMGG